MGHFDGTDTDTPSESGIDQTEFSITDTSGQDHTPIPNDGSCERASCCKGVLLTKSPNTTIETDSGRFTADTRFRCKETSHVWPARECVGSRPGFSDADLPSNNAAQNNAEAQRRQNLEEVQFGRKLATAIRRGEHGKVKELLALPQISDRRRRTRDRMFFNPLMVAACHNKQEIMILLLVIRASGCLYPWLEFFFGTLSVWLRLEAGLRNPWFLFLKNLLGHKKSQTGTKTCF